MEYRVGHLESVESRDLSRDRASRPNKRRVTEPCFSLSPCPKPPPAKVFRNGRPTHTLPEGRRPNPRRETTLDGEGQTVLTQEEQAEPAQHVGRDLPASVRAVASHQSIMRSTLLQRGVRPLKSRLQLDGSIAGRLTLFLENWSKVTQDQWILNTVQGYRIEFLREPVQPVRPKGQSGNSHEQSLIQREVQKMLQKGAVTELTPTEAKCGFYSRIFLVPKKDGSVRPVINLKRLNEYVVPHHFKMEGIHTLKDLLRRNDWMTKVDLKDAYFMIPIHNWDRPVLRFSVRERHYQFTCLPFGLSCAPYVFTKTLKPVTTTLRD